MSALLAYTDVCYMHAWYLWWPQERLGSLDIGDYKPTYGCWESNLGTLEGPLVLLNTELSLQSQQRTF